MVVVDIPAPADDDRDFWADDAAPVLLGSCSCTAEAVAPGSTCTTADVGGSNCTTSWDELDGDVVVAVVAATGGADKENDNVDGGRREGVAVGVDVDGAEDGAKEGISEGMAEDDDDDGASVPVPVPGAAVKEYRGPVEGASSPG